jgi:hypothetical protein
MPLPTVLARRLAAVLLALGVAALAWSPSAGAVADTEASAQPATRAAGINTWKCQQHKDRMGKTCAKITSFTEKFDVDYRRTFFNKYRNQKITVQCTTSKQTTWKFGVTATVEAEAGVIFAKAKTSISGSIERSSTTTDTASATFRLKPRRYAHCERGMYEYSWKGEVKRVRCHPSQGCHTTRKHYSAHAPSRDAFFIGPGRG